MKIKNIEIDDRGIVITLDESVQASKVYIDSLCNDKYKYSAEDSEHTYVVENPSIIENTILIDFKLLSPELDTSAFTVLINGTLGFYYDDKELYYREIELLTSYCSTCLDQHQKERMVLFTVKKSLLDYAIQNDIIEEAIAYYNDLARMLNIDYKYNVGAGCSGRCKRVVKCSNGICSLC